MYKIKVSKKVEGRAPSRIIAVLPKTKNRCNAPVLAAPDTPSKTRNSPSQIIASHSSDDSYHRYSSSHAIIPIHEPIDENSFRNPKLS